MMYSLAFKASAKKLHQLLQPLHHKQPCGTVASKFLRSLHSIVSSHKIPCSPIMNSRGMVCAPNNNIDDAGAAMIGVDNRVPTTIVTGFLGAGKTTLIKRILKSKHGKQIAVIENEFGEVDIDGALISWHSKPYRKQNDDVIVVDNGCLCCTMREDLVEMLLWLVRKKDVKYDHILIETTGLAKPGPVIEAFSKDELVSQHVKLDGVVTLIDCKNAMKHLNQVKPRFVVNEALEQVAYADRIILNKIDLVCESELEALTDKIKHINGMAQIKQAEYGSVDIDFVLGIGGYDLERIENNVHVEDSCSASHHYEDGDDKTHHHHQHNHVHDSTVTSVSIVAEGNLDLNEVNDWLERLKDGKGEDLYRMKGVLSVHGSDQRYVFQGVHTTLDGCPGEKWGPDEKRINKLVFIGRNLDESSLQKAFKGCLI